MRHPTTNIRLNGLVPKRTKGKARPATKKSKSPGTRLNTETHLVSKPSTVVTSSLIAVGVGHFRVLKTLTFKTTLIAELFL